MAHGKIKYIALIICAYLTACSAVNSLAPFDAKQAALQTKVMRNSSLD